MVGLLYCSAEPNSKYQATTVKGYLEDLGYTCKEYTFADSNDIASVTQQQQERTMFSMFRLTIRLLPMQRS